MPHAAYQNHDEQHAVSVSTRLNWLRASVLGANDGIVSVSALVVGVASASATFGTLLITGVAGLLAGALSMAVGEYISVSSQRDTEQALLNKERYELENFSEYELEELTQIYESKGLKRETAERVAKELTAHDVFSAHVDAELGIDPENLVSPWIAAGSSAVSFSIGAVIPLLAILLTPEQVRIPATFVAVFIALIITGIFSARVSGARTALVVLRMVIGGILAMAITFGIGKLL